jgi:transposase
MKDYTLSKKQIAALEKFHRTLRDKRKADRVKAVIALSKGWSAAEVAEILLFDEKTSRHYFDCYQKSGLEALLDDNYSGAEPKLDEHQMSELESYLENAFCPMPNRSSHISINSTAYPIR